MFSLLGILVAYPCSAWDKLGEAKPIIAAEKVRWVSPWLNPSYGLLSNIHEAIEGCLSVDVAEPKAGGGRVFEIVV
jgi:hypothetical protein